LTTVSEATLSEPGRCASTSEPIDLVYTWVDGDDPALHADLARLASGAHDTNPERFRDRFELLRYSLRSVERFLPWIRNVYLFTRRPHVPAWLEIDHPRIRVVHHDEVPDFAAYLPTFNSAVIESFVTELPGLSDRFLYCNDDFLFGAPTTQDDFLTSDGRTRLMGTYMGESLPFRVYRNKWVLFGAGEVEHTPRLFDRDLLRGMLQRRAGALHRTRTHRFRAPDDLRPDRVYRVDLLRHHRERARVVPYWELRRFHRFCPVENDPALQRRRLDELRRMRPQHYCLNDDQGLEPDPDVTRQVQAFLSEWYPTESSFERGAIR